MEPIAIPIIKVGVSVLRRRQIELPRASEARKESESLPTNPRLRKRVRAASPPERLKCNYHAYDQFNINRLDEGVSRMMSGRFYGSGSESVCHDESHSGEAQHTPVWRIQSF